MALFPMNLSGGGGNLPDGQIFCCDWANSTAQMRSANKTITTRTGAFAVFGAINGKYSQLTISRQYSIWGLIKKDGSFELKGTGSTPSQGGALTSDDAYFLALGTSGSDYTFTLS